MAKQKAKDRKFKKDKLLTNPSNLKLKEIERDRKKEAAKKKKAKKGKK